MLKSSEGARLELLRNALRDVAAPSAEVHRFIGTLEGDDAAIVPLDVSHALVIASDFIRGSGFTLFKLGRLRYFDLGFYLVAANLSDIAAMGVRPYGLTTVVRYNPSLTDEQFVEVFEGIRSAAIEHEVLVVGGDIGGYDCDVFAATAFGFADPGRVLTREGTQHGDLLCVTGRVGRAIAALVYFSKLLPAGLTLSELKENHLLHAWKRPQARIQEGQLLAASSATACQDVSDGLKATIDQLARSGGISFSVDYADVPVDAVAREVAMLGGIDPVALAMSASVDFELLFTLPAGQVEDCRARFESIGQSFATIGRTNRNGRNVLVQDGVEDDLPGIPWDQQEGDFVQAVLDGRP
jgi:thiamine-monophosphate kinase